MFLSKSNEQHLLASIKSIGILLLVIFGVIVCLHWDFLFKANADNEGESIKIMKIKSFPSFEDDQKLQNNLLREYGSSIRDIIREENRMINDRIMWMLTLNGLLFAALGFYMQKRDAMPWLPWLLSGIGSVSSLSFGFSLQCALKAILGLNNHWKVVAAAFENLPLPPVIGLGNCGIKDQAHFLLPWNCLPLLFFLCWVFVAGQTYLAQKK